VRELRDAVVSGQNPLSFNGSPIIIRKVYDHYRFAVRWSSIFGGAGGSENGRGTCADWVAGLFDPKANGNTGLLLAWGRIDCVCGRVNNRAGSSPGNEYVLCKGLTGRKPWFSLKFHAHGKGVIMKRLVEIEARRRAPVDRLLDTAEHANGTNGLPMEISVVVPVYKEEGNIEEFVRRTSLILEEVTSSFEIIFATDPSPDRTRTLILACREKDPRVKLLQFSRRFGQPMASLAGLEYSSGQAVIIMDVDLQDPPELILEMVQKWKEGFDVVYAQRRTRDGETWLKRVISFVGYKLINRVADVNIPANTGDFRLMSRRVVDEINSLGECHGFLRGMVALVGFNQTSIQFDRPSRFSGKGNYNAFTGSLRIGFNGVFCFSNYALTLSTQAGFTIAFVSLLVGVIYGVLKLFGVPFPMGNPTIVILILFLGGIQLIGIGILGEYIGRIYEEVRQRPRFIVAEAQGFTGRLGKL
jgi:polyisoprenyl-phosphate glycosyltransferase